MCFFQRTRFVLGSTATIPPVWYSPGGLSPLLASVSESVAAVEDVVHAAFAAVHHDLAHPAVDPYVGQHRRHGVVHVPDAVVDRLEMPPVFAGLQVDRDEGAGEQVQTTALRTVLSGPAAA